MTDLSNSSLVIYLRNNTFILPIIIIFLLYSADLLYISPLKRPTLLAFIYLLILIEIKDDGSVKMQH